ncbi:DUF4190 domain-containing protein [Streptomyces blattellae]|uniref:DUF4190 domain-containing protein n=1 Tax=Streptomyces blattellae TaxID=2569855 RepID=UPI0018ACF753|nr:DUF4190 domain-containing protein [Streptomyces blattellae]
MSDDAQTPEARDTAAHWPTPPGETGDSAAADDAAEVPLAEGAESAVDVGKADPAGAASAGGGGEPVNGPADARPEPNPWAPVSGPSVRDQQTVASVPPTDTAPTASDGNQEWANPVAPGTREAQRQPPHSPHSLHSSQSPQPWANPFAPPAPTPPADGSANLFAPPAPSAPSAPAAPYAHGEPVPPPPIAPDGPGQIPYGYPVGPGYPAGPGYQAGHGHPAGPGYPAGHGHPTGPGYPPPPGAGYYGWPGMQPTPANGMGTASLVLGIIAAVFFCLWPLAIVLGILAVIFGALGRARARRGESTNPGQALGGIICGAVGIALGFGIIVLLIAL